MKNNHAIVNRAYVRAWWVALALGCFSLSAQAAFPKITQSAAGKTTTVSAGSGGSGSPLADVIAKNPTSRAGGGGGVDVGAKGTANVGNGRVPVDVGGTVAKDAIVGGVVGAITGGIPGAVIGAATPLILDYMKSAGVRNNPQTGAPEQTDPEVCTVGPCLEWSYSGIVPADTWLPSKQSACDYHKAWYNAQSFPEAIDKDVATADQRCLYTRVYKSTGEPEGGPFPLPLTSRSAPPKSPTWYPSTPQAIRDALYKKDPQPGIVNELDGIGAPLPVQDVTVTGPIVITGPTVTTTNNIDNSVKTTTTTNNYTYNGNRVTNSGTTTKSETTKADGTKTEETTTTTSPGDEEPAKPEDPVVQCDKYPNSLGCSEIDTPSLDIPKDTKNITFREESVFSGGSCPANKTMSLRNVGAVTVWDWNQACSYIVQIRALVLALATFAAFLIILPGKEVRT